MRFSGRHVLKTTWFALLAIAALSIVSTVAGAPPRGAGSSVAVPRTPWGDPDLQATYSNDNEFGIPFERPARFDGRRQSDLSTDELAQYLREQRDQRRPPDPADPFLEFNDPQNSRAWLISDPPDGKVPAPTEDARRTQTARQAADRRATPRGDADSYTDRSAAERCLGSLLPFPMRAGREGNVYEIVQAPGIVAIRYERQHLTRVIPVDGRPHVARGLNTYEGDARGRWDGNTLVVETVYSEKAYEGYPGIRSGSLTTIERFAPLPSRDLEFTITYIDPATWVTPFSWALRLTRSDTKQVLEYACHEGNYGLRNILSAARNAERFVSP